MVARREVSFRPASVPTRINAASGQFMPAMKGPLYCSEEKEWPQPVHVCQQGVSLQQGNVSSGARGQDLSRESGPESAHLLCVPFNFYVQEGEVWLKCTRFLLNFRVFLCFHLELRE